jgi:hypothetical protein
MYSEEVALGMMAMIAVDMMSHYAILYRYDLTLPFVSRRT